MNFMSYLKQRYFLSAVLYILLFLMAVISIILGVLAIVNPFEAAATLIMIIGACLLISGITDIFSGIYFLRKVNDYKKNS